MKGLLCVLILFAVSAVFSAPSSPARSVPWLASPCAELHSQKFYQNGAPPKMFTLLAIVKTCPASPDETCRLLGIENERY
jgi:hypothetical protein